MVWTDRQQPQRSDRLNERCAESRDAKFPDQPRGRRRVSLVILSQIRRPRLIEVVALVAKEDAVILSPKPDHLRSDVRKLFGTALARQNVTTQSLQNL